MLTDNNNKWEGVEVGGPKLDPQITFTQSKTIRFNKRLLKMYELDNATHVQVLFNFQGDRTRVGFIFSDHEVDSKSRKISWHEAGGASISGHAVITRLEKRGILSSLHLPLRFSPYLEDYTEEVEMIIIDIVNKKDEGRAHY